MKLTPTVASCLFAVLAAASTVWSAPAVTGVSGTVSHGSAITISGSGFGTKSQAAPLVWDITSEQYVNGTNKNAYSGLGNGSAIPGTVWPNPDNVSYYTSRANRNPYVTAHYAGVNPSNGHVYLRAPNSAPSTQKKFYLSFYRKVKNGGYTGSGSSPGGGDGSTKIVRVCGTDGSGTGTCFLAAMVYGERNTVGDQSSWINDGGETTWVRWEVYVDVNKQWFDGWKNGHYHLGTYSGAGGSVEFRPAADWRFRTGLSGYQFDAPWLPANIGIVPAVFGYDDGHSMSAGQEVDLSEIYYDNTLARVEISDKATWSDSPSATAHREVQGRLTSWSNTQIQLTLFQGGFDSLPGKYLYVIDANGVVNTNGYLLTAATVPTVTVAASTPTAYESGQIPGVFTVTRTGATTSALAVNYTVSGTAVGGTDYTPTLGGTVIIPSGAASATITVTPVDEKLVAGSKTAVVTVSPNAAYTVGTPASATVTILYNDTFQPGDANGDGAVGSADLAIIIRDWDPVGTSGPHTWAQGDFDSNGAIGDSDLALLIKNWNPVGLPTVMIAASTPTAYESGQIPGVFAVSRLWGNSGTANALAVSYSISGTAVNGTDYSALSGTVTIPAGSTSATITVTPADLGIIGGSKTVTLTLGGSGYMVGTPASATVTISDNDSAPTTTTLVNFGSSVTGNAYGLTGWNTPILGRYSTYSSAGPAGVKGSYTGNGVDGGVIGTSRTFAIGEQVIVTWYNTGTSSLTLTPKISLNDSQDYTLGNGPWYDMTSLTLAGGATGTTTYTINSTTAGSHSLVNVCRVLNGGDALLLDKIELQTLGTSSPSVQTAGAVMTSSAVTAAAGAGGAVLSAPAIRPATTLPPPRKLVHWSNTTPATQPSPKK